LEYKAVTAVCPPALAHCLCKIETITSGLDVAFGFINVSMKKLLLALLLASFSLFAASEAKDDEILDKMKKNLEELKTNLKDMEKSVQEHAKKQHKKVSEELSETGDSVLETTQKAIGNLASELKALESKVRGLREEKKTPKN